MILLLEYKGKTYFVQDNYAYEQVEKDEIPFIWVEGNYACDCNRSQFIQEQITDSFPSLPCGDEIKLIGAIDGEPSIQEIFNCSDKDFAM